MSDHSFLEEADPRTDGRAFRRCLGQFATGVTVITAAAGDQLAGMTVNSFSSLSLEPPLVLWSIRRQSGSLALFQQASHFAVNVLADDQVAVSNLFASSGPDRFAQVGWQPGHGGAPLIEGAIARMECALETLHESGDHFIVIGRVERVARFAGEPLLFAQGRYAVVSEHPGTADSGSSPAAAPEAAFADVAQASLTRLLHYTSHVMSASFDEDREAAGLSLPEFRIYGWLRTQPRTIAQLKQLAYLGGRDTDDTVAELLARGDLQRDAQGLLSLTESGRQRADDVAARLAAFEAQLFKDVPAADMASTRRVLAAVAQHALRMGTGPAGSL